jgi:prepilin-type N-terminal cleavage/methylation domain-containing protein
LQFQPIFTISAFYLQPIAITTLLPSQAMSLNAHRLHQHHNHPASGALGFSMLEIMIAMAVFASLIVYGKPHFNDFQKNSAIRDAAAAIEADLRHTRMTAIIHNSKARYSFSGSSTYTMSDATKTDPNLNTSGPFRYIDYENGTSYTLTDTITPIDRDVRFTADSSQITFTRFGTNEAGATQIITIGYSGIDCAVLNNPCIQVQVAVNGTISQIK